MTGPREQEQIPEWLPGTIEHLPAGDPPTYEQLLSELGRRALAYDELMQQLAEKTGYYDAVAAVRAHPDHPKAEQ